MKRLKILAMLFWMVTGIFPGYSAGLVMESGDFVAEIQRLKNLAFGSGSGLYVAPTTTQLNDFAVLATALRSGDVATADTLASLLNYELVQYADTVSGRVLHGLREQLTGEQQSLGWGSYFIDLSFSQNALVESPHPLYDTNSWEVAARAFRQTGALAFMLAGAHRNANGSGTADVAHLEQSVFETVHEAWNGGSGEYPAWQIHGFNDANHNFPANTDAVLSVGDGSVSDEIVALDAALQDEGFLSYAYNILAITDPLNVAVNESISGATFSSLGATTNIQGGYSRSIGGTFTHVELEQSIRFNPMNRQLAADAIAAAIMAVNNPVPSDGDVNSDGDINIVDILLATRIALGQLSPTASQLAHGDVAPLINSIPSPDGVINAADILVITRKVFGLVSF